MLHVNRLTGLFLQWSMTQRCKNYFSTLFVKEFALLFLWCGKTLPLFLVIPVLLEFAFCNKM